MQLFFWHLFSCEERFMFFLETGALRLVSAERRSGNSSNWNSPESHDAAMSRDWCFRAPNSRAFVRKQFRASPGYHPKQRK